jgi:hypothetical protein
MNYTQEENNYPRAFAATSVIMVLIAALCYFWIISMPPKQEDGTGGILVNYGTTDEGTGTDYMNTEQPSMAEKANQSKPDKVTPAPPTEEKTKAETSDKDVVTQNNEDAPEVAAKTKKPNTAVATTPTKPVEKPTVNQNALYKGKTNTGTGEGDGNTGTPGNQGKPTGSTLTNNYNGTGSGNGGNLIGMNQRSFTSRPIIDDDGKHPGVVVVDIRVDRNGNVIYASGGGRGTTVVDPNLIRRCEEAVKNSHLNALENVSLQEGQVVFRFKNN